MSDLVKQLKKIKRRLAEGDPGKSERVDMANSVQEVADLIQSQAARIERLEAALRLQGECSLSTTSLFDEEGVEGWIWEHPDGREWWEVGDWNEPPVLHPDARAILEKLEKEEGK